MERPLSRRSEEVLTGSFRYPISPEPKGVFAFSFYFPAKEKNFGRNPYLKGIDLYAKAIQREDSVFKGWRIVLYVDSFTSAILQEEGLLQDPVIDLVVVTWPYYTTKDGQINGDVMRCMRLRAFFEYRSVPVFMRDADTLWAVSEMPTATGTGKVMEIKSEVLYEWEANYLRGALEHPNSFVFGSSLAYKKFWHETDSAGVKTPLGAFAGLQSTIPFVRCFQDDILWEQILDFITARSKRVETSGASAKRVGTRFSDEEDRSRIGKDEQILVYVVLPACWDSLFFFELDLYGKRGYALQDSDIYKASYPTYIFQRGNNANLRNLFLKAKTAEFRTNLEANRQARMNRNKGLERQAEDEIRALVRGLGNAEWKMNTKPPYYFGDVPSSLQSAVEELNRVFGEQDPVLRDLYKIYEAQAKKAGALRSAFADRMKYRAPNFNKAGEREALVAESDAKNKAMEALVKHILETTPKQAILAKVNPMKRDVVGKTLDMVAGLPFTPYQVEKTPTQTLNSVGLGKFAKFLQAKPKGGRRKRTRRSKGKIGRNAPTRRR